MGEKMTISTNSYMLSNLLENLKTVYYIYETILSLKKIGPLTSLSRRTMLFV